MIDGFAKKHLPQSRELFDHISKLDFESGDYFCFKSGGDGDNGEVLMDYFDDFFSNKLEGQETVKKVLSDRQCEVSPHHYERKGFCPKCHQEVKLILNRNYCGFCGQEIKWNE